MKPRFILFRRKQTYYCEDTKTGTQTSLKTKNKAEANTLLATRNEAYRQPALNLQIARAYLSAADPRTASRTWQEALEAIVKTKHGSTQKRWQRAAKDTALDPIRQKRLLETQGEDFLAVLKGGCISTQVHLRKLHNFCLDMGWLAWPILPKRKWPRLDFKEKRAVTAEEHQAIVKREGNSQTRSFYEMLWHLGGSQSDIANLKAEDFDLKNRVVSYSRQKSGVISQLHLGEDALAVLANLPKAGPLFPRLAVMDQKHRAKQFARRCQGLGIKGISLHSYRYAWAERAKSCGYPERFAQEALGHTSKAVHRAYARKAKMNIPSLEDFEKGRVSPGAALHLVPEIAAAA